MQNADYLRLLTLILGAIVCVETIAIVAVHAWVHAGVYAWVRRGERTGPRFLPTHIATIAASFLVFSVWGEVEMLHRWGQPHITWRIPTLICAFSLANVAQGSMLRIVYAQRDQRR